MIERALSYISTKLASGESKKPKRSYRTINHEEAYKIHLEQQRFRDDIARCKYESEIHPSTTLPNPTGKIRLPGEVKSVHTEPTEHELYP